MKLKEIALEKNGLDSEGSEISCHLYKTKKPEFPQSHLEYLWFYVALFYL